MTDHYRAAQETLLEGARRAEGLRDADDETRDRIGKHLNGLWTQAQAHATLAVVDALAGSAERPEIVAGWDPAYGIVGTATADAATGGITHIKIAPVPIGTTEELNSAIYKTLVQVAGVEWEHIDEATQALSDEIEKGLRLDSRGWSASRLRRAVSEQFR